VTLAVEMRHTLGAFCVEVAFKAPAGITVLFGRSGSGKTTVVNAVAGLLRPDMARITLDGDTLHDSAARRFLPVHKRRLGYVFQDGRLFPHLSVARNLDFGRNLAPSDAPGPDRDEVADLLGIAHLMDRAPHALSGGEKQRVAIGRALLSRPRMLLMDEPLAALDTARKAEILPYLERLRDCLNLPVLYVSHSVPEVARLATTLVVLEEGRVARAGPAEAVLSDPDMVRQIGVRAAGAVLPARVLTHHDDGLTELRVVQNHNPQRHVTVFGISCISWGDGSRRGGAAAKEQTQEQGWPNRSAAASWTTIVTSRLLTKLTFREAGWALEKLHRSLVLGIESGKTPPYKKTRKRQVFNTIAGTDQASIGFGFVELHWP